MKVAAGVDGCKGGWIMVRRTVERGTADFVIAERWRDLPPADMIAVDMPIGLPDSGERGCDLLARKKLGPRASSIFLGLRRPLLDFRDYAEANAWAKTDGAGLSVQAWNILEKIRELDKVMTPEAQARIRETHPELAFDNLNGAPVQHPKRLREGLAERQEILRRNGFGRLPAWLGILDRQHAAPDDLFDACALSLVAQRMLRGEAKRLPEDDPPRDARGLKMEIWY